MSTTYAYPQIARVTSAPKLLFVGGNGVKTYGVRVTALGESNQGYCNDWSVNDATFLGHPEQVKGKLGLTDEEYDTLAAEIRDLIEKQI